MATYSQTPGDLDLEVGLGDDFSMLIDFDISLTGYTFESKVTKPSGDVTITVTNTDLSAGQITLSLTDVQITSIGFGRYSWYLTWTTGSASRRVLAGDFTVKDKA